ncbi:cysteine lyase [Synechococcus sp. SynAce01]|nr:cysteine lyase [Synechococcus sp. SynAce01]
MPALANKTYFNYGGQGPLPSPSLAAITESWQRIQELGPFTGSIWPWLAAQTQGLRADLAVICGVPPHRLALTENVSSGCVLPLWGLPWQGGDELLIGDCEHPGVVAACRELAHREGLTLSTLAVGSIRPGSGVASDGAVLDALDQALTPRTRLVVLSHLLWNTGLVMPIEAVAQRLEHHPRHPWLLVDAAQSVGSLPVAAAASAADIYAFTGHKWCCGPEGLGGVALSERILSASRPTLGGWRSLANENDAGLDGPGGGHDPWHHDGRRFEVATSCAPLMAGLRCSLELLDAVGGAPARLALIRERSSQLWLGLQAIPGLKTLLQEPPPAGLVSVELEGDGRGHTPESLVEQLGQQGVWLRSLDHPHCLRACTHLTTTSEEVEQLLAALNSFLH